MEQIFIRIRKGEKIINKDIMYSSHKERQEWYKGLSKGQVAHVAEQFLENKMMEENLK